MALRQVPPLVHRPNLLLYRLAVRLPKQHIRIIVNPTLQRELINLATLLLLLDDRLHQIQNAIVVGPQSRLHLREDQHTVDVNLKGAGLGELDDLSCVGVKVAIVVGEFCLQLTVVLWELVLEDDDVGDVALQLFLY